MTQPPAGWYEDPDGTTRWWDGTQWTEHTQAPPAASGPAPGPAATPTAGPPAPLGGPTHLAYHPGQSPQQPGQPGQPGQSGYAQQPWTPYAGGPGKRPGRSNAGLLLGVGGGVLALIVVAIVIVLVTRGGDDNKSADDPLTPTAQPTSAAPSPTTAPTPTAPFSEEPTSPAPTRDGGGKRGWPKELPTNAPDREPDKADVVDAPKNASVAAFCKAEQLILDLPKNDLHAYYAWFWYRIQLGTPADMSAKARNGWIEDVAADALFNKADEDAFTNYETSRCY